jgi:hypothetical protein
MTLPVNGKQGLLDFYHINVFRYVYGSNEGEIGA